MTDDAVLAELSKISKRLESLEKRTERLEELLLFRGRREKPLLLRGRELPIPEVRYTNFTLRGRNVTLKKLYEIGSGTADDISKRTGRSKSVEANYLNRLYELGLVNKEVVGKKVYYHITDYGKEVVEKLF